MAGPRKLSVSVENFGPVREGKFGLSPLTIFIGPNNSGKSYMALLVYALSEALLGRVHGRYTWSFWHGEIDQETLEMERQFRRLHSRALESRQCRLPFGKLPTKLRPALLRAVERGLPLVQQQIEEVLGDYFGCSSVLDLVRKGNGSEALAIRLNESEEQEPLLSVAMDPGDTRPKTQVVFQQPKSLLTADLGERPSRIEASGIAACAWTEFLRENGIAPHASYLPAARSGILQGWPLVASMAVQALRLRVGLERTEAPPLTGVAGDFLQVLWGRVMQGHPSRRPQVAQQMRPVLQVLEEDLFAGDVDMEAGESDRGQIFYKTKHLRMPLSRASSMVAELAPLVLWVKYLLEPGDLLIIDEPEAHLHPKGQRRVAQALVRLVHAGVRVLCTTHSPTILHQVSNYVLAGGASSRKRSKLGFSEEDLLAEEDVGVYLFDAQKNGTHISPVPIEPGFGISEDEFVRVAEAIGDETYSLTTPTRK